MNNQYLFIYQDLVNLPLQNSVAIPEDRSKCKDHEHFPFLDLTFTKSKHLLTRYWIIIYMAILPPFQQTTARKQKHFVMHSSSKGYAWLSKPTQSIHSEK